MKTIKRTGKKALSLFMAALMVLTAWVFVAPQKAEAITGGNYYVDITYNITNNCDGSSNAYTGESSFNKNSNRTNKIGFSLYYKTNHGQGTEYEVYWDIGSKDLKAGQASGSGATVNQPTKRVTTDGEGHATATLPGFPTKLFVAIDNEALGDVTKFTITSIKVGSSSSNTTEIWHGEIYMESTWNQYYGTLTSSYGWSGNSTGSYAKCSTTTKNWNYPKADKVVCSTAPATSYTVPKDSSTQTIKHVTYCEDQYGVRLAVTPTVTNSPTNVSGITFSNSDANANYTQTCTVTNAAKIAGTTDSRTLKMNASYTFNGATKTCNHSITLNDPTYNFTFKNTHGSTSLNPGDGTVMGKKYGNTFGSTPTGARDGFTFLGFFRDSDVADSYETDNTSGKTKLTSSTVYDADYTWYAAWQANKYTATFKYKDAAYADITKDVTDFYGRSLSAPDITSPINVGVDYTYTFTGWSPSVPSTMPAENKTYIAQYSEEKHYANYDEVVKQITLAENKQEEDLYREGAYTAETTQAFENALAAAVASNNDRLLLSKQSQVDTIAKNLENARKNLKIKTFTVLFVDEDGAILKDGYFYVEYGSKVIVPSSPSKDSDANYHYTFDSWVSDGSDDLSACNYVTDNLKYIAKFNKTAHSFTNTTVSSTCTQDGVIKHTCSCGYSYTSVNENDKAHHTFSRVEIVPATCATAGYTANKCTVCGAIDESSKQTVSALGHSWGNWSVAVAADCLGEGVNVRTCSRCDGKDIEKTAKLSHSWSNTVVAPTCTSKGYTLSTCSNCGSTKIGSFTDAIAHNYVENAAEYVAPTCIGEGHKVSYCSACGLKKIDIVAASGHSWKAEAQTDYEPTCTSAGQKSVHCSVCDAIREDSVETVDALDHEYSAEATTLVEATCNGKGLKAYYCERGCGAMKTEEVAALEHSLNETVTTAATCTTAGSKVTSCSRCDYEKTEVIQPTGHNYVESNPHAASCEDAGYVTMECSVCYDSYKKYTAAATGNHNWNITSTVSHGETVVSGVCTVCGATFTETVQSAHDFKNIKSCTPATCKKEGTLVLSCKDENCAEELTVTLPVNSKAHAALSEENRVESTCVKDGSVKLVCDDCGEVMATVTLPANGHNFKKSDYKAATCTEEGYIKYKCENCTENATDVLAKDENAHSFVKGEHIDATCETPAYDVYTCEHCSDASYKDYSGEAAGHDWVTTTAQNGSALVITCKCSNCNATHTATETIFAGHNYVIIEEVKAATCTDTGEIRVKCSDEGCNAYITVIVPANPDAHELWTDVSQNCTGGTIRNFCGRCKTNIGDQYNISGMGHDFSGTETVVEDATCEEDGLKTVQCSRKGCTATQNVVIPKTGHNWDNGTYHAADCTHGAYTTYKCLSCEKTYDAVADGAAALGHDWGDWKVTTPSTNDAEGELTRVCGNDSSHVETAPIPAGGHKLELTAEEKATCTAPGTQTFTCTAHDDCGVKLEVTAEKLAHEYEVKTTTEATCTEAGVVTVVCKNCGEKFNVVNVNALGHDFSEKIDAECREATCESVGYETYKCSRCEEKKVVYLVNLAAHQWSGWSTVQEQTDLLPKIEVRQCSVCKLYDYKYTAPAGEHQYDSGVVTEEATCEADGIKTFTCVGTDCSCTDANRASYTETIPATGHKAKAEYTAATCTESGKYASVCSVCEKELDSYVIDPIGHKETVTVTEPTCSESGSKVYTCAVCGEATKQAEEIPSVDHAYIKTEETVEATCTTPKYDKYQCKYGCGSEKLVKSGEALGHDTAENYVPVKDATCTAAGYSEWKCSKCDTVLGTKVIDLKAHDYTETVNVLFENACEGAGYSYKKCACGAIDPSSFENFDKAHTYIYETETPATCTTEGKVVAKCSVCDNVNVEITVPALGHEYGEGEVHEGTCSEEGFVLYTCSRCAEGTEGHSLKKFVGTKNHNYVAGDTVGATCTSGGYQIFTCEYCGDEFKKLLEDPAAHDYKKQTSSVEPTCHSSGHYVFKCSACDAGYEYDVSATGNHDIKSEIIQKQSCTETEKTKYYCSNEGCDYKRVEITKPLADHVWGDWKVTKEATETEDGEQRRDCENCDLYETAPIPASVHHWQEIAALATVASCDSAATRTYKCTGCTICNDENGYKTYTVTVGDRLQHNVVVDYKAATCTEKGYNKIYCSLCNEVFEDTSIEKIAHAFNNYVADSYEAPTCQKDGKMVYACVHDCGETQEVVIPHNVDAHNMVKYSETAATCTTAGSVTYKCDNEGCDHTYVVLTAQPVAHSYNDTPDVVVKATCEADGYVVYNCKNCDNQKYEKTADKLNHKNTTTVIVDSTCEAAGYKRVTCDDCGKLISETAIEKKNHTEKTVTVEPDCTTPGSITVKCSVCGETLSVTTIEAKGHTWGEWLVIGTTSCEVGKTEIRTCSSCGETETRTSGFGEHTFDNGVVTEPTCEADGYTTVTCTVCGYSYVKDYTPKTAHKYSGEFAVVLEPTCHSSGARAQRCIYCGKIDPDRDHYYYDIQPVAHNYGDWTVVEPTCENNGYRLRTCQNPGCPEGYDGHTEKILIAKNGHSYDDWTITKNATCLENGEKFRTCYVCHKVETEVIKTSGHSIVSDLPVDATCTTTGLTAGCHCSVCGTVIVAQEVVPMGRHYDLSGDGRCDTCGVTMHTETGEDTCFCHKTGISGFIYKIMLVFWKLFKINQYCACGAKHY